MQRYTPLLQTLVDDQLYTAQAIVALAQARGLIASQRARFRWQLAMNWLARSRGFPSQGDDASGDGENGPPAWYGRRWKQRPDPSAEGEAAP